jgi:hypothetical protein
MLFKNGDRVRLRPDLAKTFQTDHRVDWKARQGTVQGYAKVADNVIIKWDDRKTPDFWPSRALEKIL